MREKEISRENYEKKIKQEYLNSISVIQHRQLPSYQDNNNGASPSQEEKCIITASNEVSSKAHDNNENDNVRMLDNGIAEIGLERIKVDHSNPNYRKEMEEYKKQLREDRKDRKGEQPRKKTTCIFNPFILPVDIREKLHEAKVLPW